LVRARLLCVVTALALYSHSACVCSWRTACKSTGRASTTTSWCSATLR
jgi:hypothetical protein